MSNILPPRVTSRRKVGQWPINSSTERHVARKRHAVYRCYDHLDRLLYVGVSYTPFLRLDQHRATSPWYCDMVRFSTSVYRNRWVALVGEAVAIETEAPLWNVVRYDDLVRRWGDAFTNERRIKYAEYDA